MGPFYRFNEKDQQIQSGFVSSFSLALVSVYWLCVRERDVNFEAIKIIIIIIFEV